MSPALRTFTMDTGVKSNNSNVSVGGVWWWSWLRSMMRVRSVVAVSQITDKECPVCRFWWHQWYFIWEAALLHWSFGGCNREVGTSRPSRTCKSKFCEVKWYKLIKLIKSSMLGFSSIVVFGQGEMLSTMKWPWVKWLYVEVRSVDQQECVGIPLGCDIRQPIATLLSGATGCYYVIWQHLWKHDWVPICLVLTWTGTRGQTCSVQACLNTNCNCHILREMTTSITQALTFCCELSKVMIKSQWSYRRSSS